MTARLWRTVATLRCDFPKVFSLISRACLYGQEEKHEKEAWLKHNNKKPQHLLLKRPEKSHEAGKLEKLEIKFSKSSNYLFSKHHNLSKKFIIVLKTTWFYLKLMNLLQHNYSQNSTICFEKYIIYFQNYITHTCIMAQQQNIYPNKNQK